MKTHKYQITGMTCSACSSHVHKAASLVEGVVEVQVNLLTNSMIVTCEDFVSDDTICSAVSACGYGCNTAENNKKKEIPQDNNNKDTKKIIARLICSVILLVPLMYLSMGYTMWDFPLPSVLTSNPTAIALCQLLLSAMVMIINQKFFINGFKGLLRKAPNMDTLVCLGSGASFIYSTAVVFIMTGNPDMAGKHLHGLYFESAAMILTLITVGKLLESYSKGKTTSAIKKLMELAPTTCHVVRNGIEQTISVEDLIVGDVFLVRPGENIPADGTVIEGSGTVDESALTGESLPVDKEIGKNVYAGTMNQHGFLKCTATKVHSDTTLCQIIELVENTAASKAPIAKVADKVSGVFVPVVLIIALITGIIWLIADKDVGFALARAISVLVISCPCALGLATPVAIMVGSGTGARNGILFKTATSLEQTGKTNIVVLDKTGTVTKGEMTVTDIITSNQKYSRNTILEYALALELKSEHPISRAIVKSAQDKNILCDHLVVSSFEALPGHGVKAQIEGTTYYGVNAAFIENSGLMTEEIKETSKTLASSGKTPIFISTNSEVLGIIAVSDVIKEDSADAVAQLKKMGIRVIMLTGDNEITARAIALQAGIDEVISDVLPADKEKVITSLKESGNVLMVGDGINDAPALMSAHVGVAIGAGSDIAIDSSSVVLMKSSLSDVVGAIILSKKTLRNIYQNLFWAFFYNCIGIPLAAGAFFPAFGITLSPMIGAGAMSLSSICVVTNALRLNFVKITNKKTQEVTTMKKTMIIDGMMCIKCQAHVEAALLKVEGVDKVTIDLKKKKAVIESSVEISDDILMNAVSEAGYTPVSCK